MRRVAGALLLASLAAAAPGCMTLAMLRPLPRACPGALPAVATLGADFSFQARYRVQSRGRDLALTLAAEKTGARLVLLGLDPLGTSVFALVQEGSEVRRERHLRPLFPFAPENVLQDLLRARFADLGGEGARVERSGDSTTIERVSCDWRATVVMPPG